MQNLPLIAAEFDLIDEILLKYGDDHSVLNACELDGYFTALVSSPTQLDIAEWFPGIWGGQNPQWQTTDEAKQLIELSVRHINTLARQLAEQRSAFTPRFEQTEHLGQTVTLAEEWCFGYLRGVAVANWSALPAVQAGFAGRKRLGGEHKGFFNRQEIWLAEGVARAPGMGQAGQAYQQQGQQHTHVKQP